MSKLFISAAYLRSIGLSDGIHAPHVVLEPERLVDQVYVQIYGPIPVLCGDRVEVAHAGHVPLEVVEESHDKGRVNAWVSIAVR